MKICVLSCSPKRESSLTVQSIRFLQQFFPEDQFDIHYTSSVECPDEVVESACDSDLIMILSSIFHLHVHGQMISMLPDLTSKMRAKIGDGINSKFFTYMTTSNFLYEIGAHRYVTRWAKSEKLNFLRPLSLKDDSMLTKKGHAELYSWYTYSKDTMECLKSGSTPKVTEPRRVAIVSDGLIDEAVVNRVADMYTARGCEVETFNLNNYNIKPCSACFTCYSSRKCHMEDDFPALVDKMETGTDLVVTMGKLSLGMLSQKFKIYTDRHVQFGRCGNGEEAMNLSLVVTDEDVEDRITSLAQFEEWNQATNGIGRTFFVGAFFARIGNDDVDVARPIDDSIIAMNNELYGQRNTFSENLNTRFAELAYYLQNMVPLDYEHYKMEGYYDKKPVNTNVSYIHDLKGGLMSCKMRIMAYNMALKEAGDKPELTKRRKDKNMSALERKRRGDACDQPRKARKGLFGRK